VDEPLLPPEEHVTADFAYIRWHGHGRRIWYDYEYSKDQLEEWKPKVEEVKRKSKRTYGYFNNHFNANAVKNAVEMLQMLESATPEQENALNKIRNYRSEIRLPANVQPLTSFKQDEDSLSVSDLLIRLTDTGRLSRAEQMTDKVQIRTNNSEKIKANLRGYSIEIDLADKVIRHDCDDWKKNTSKKKMCKHVNKLFLTLPSHQARQILELIWENRDNWNFI
jgi:2-oxoglutarate dehydrogenase complex dehydrogenase (E1) component-like enzyme